MILGSHRSQRDSPRPGGGYHRAGGGEDLGRHPPRLRDCFPECRRQAPCAHPLCDRGCSTAGCRRAPGSRGTLGRMMRQGSKIAMVTWPVYARLGRAQTLVLRRQEFIEAARALGASDARLIPRPILPNALSPLIVQASFNMGEAILLAAGLSFIGFGAQPPTPEWGVMISEGRDYITTQSWFPTFPL